MPRRALAKARLPTSEFSLTAGPKHYRFGKHVTYVTRSGKELDEATVHTQVKVGVPVHVHYAGTGDSILVDRVTLDED